MESLSSTIKFFDGINHVVPNQSTSSPITGDTLLFFALSVLILSLLISIVILIKNKCSNFAYSTVKPAHCSIQKSNKTTKIVCISSIILICMLSLFMCFKTFAFANNINEDTKTNQGSTIDVIKATVFDHDPFVQIEDSYIQNNGSKIITLTSINTKSINDDNNCNWKLTINNQIVYNNKSGESQETSPKIQINPNEKITIQLSTDMDLNTAQNLIEKDVLQINYQLETKEIGTSNITGVLKDADGNYLKDSKASFIDENGQTITSVNTGEDGKFLLNVNKGLKGHVLLETDKMDPVKSDTFEVTEDKNLGEFITQYSAKIENPIFHESFTYDATEHSAFENLDENLMISGITESIDAGEFYVSLKPMPEYCWKEGGTTAPKEYVWKINKAQLQVNISDYNVYYTQELNISETYSGFKGDDDKTCLDGNVEIVSGYKQYDDIGGTPFDLYIDTEKSDLSSYNYEIIYQTQHAKINVSPLEAELSWGLLNWDYDGQIHSTTCSLANKYLTDDVQVVLENNQITHVSEGPKEVKAIALSGSKALNYKLNTESSSSKNTISLNKIDPIFNTDDLVLKPNDKVYFRINSNSDATDIKFSGYSDMYTINSILGPIGGYNYEIVRNDPTQSSYEPCTITAKIDEGEDYKAAETTFKVTITPLTGTIQSVQNIPDYFGTNPTITLQENIKVDLYENGKYLNSAYSTYNGEYRMPIDENDIKKDHTYTISVDVPGVIAQQKTIDYKASTPTTCDFDNLQGIDFYNLNQLKTAADLLPSKSAGDPLYDEFQAYCNNDCIWYSNSNGAQPSSVNANDLSDLDVGKCNQNFKNQFEIDESKITPDKADISQFLFLRVVGINADKEAFIDGRETGKTAGLTMQTIRALPQGYKYANTEDSTWWGNSNNELRFNANSNDGRIYSRLNNSIKDIIMPVQKKNQDSYDSTSLSINNTCDLLFPLSYTEICTQNTESSKFDGYEYYKNDAEGSQYAWYKNNNISGKSFTNKALENLSYTNSGDFMGDSSAISTLRTPYCKNQASNLIVNNKGNISAYSAMNKSQGFAPAFCIGTPSVKHNISLNGSNVIYKDTSDKPLPLSFQVLDTSSLSFKIELKDSSYELDYVTDNGEIITPINDIYTIANIDKPHFIIAKIKGEKQAPQISGTVNITKHLGDKISREKRDEGLNVKLLNENSEILATAVTDKDSNYNMILDSSKIDTKVKLQIDAKPGTLAYESEYWNLVEGDNKKDIDTYGLDFYTLDELKTVANWLSDHSSDEKLKDSDIYKEFYSYVENDTIWYSNSHGRQPSYVNAQNTNYADYHVLTKMYMCTFAQSAYGQPDETNIDNYLFLRVIGINEDTQSNSNKPSGLTFQTIHTLPTAYTMPTGNTSWWGTSNIRSLMQENGDIYNSIAGQFTSKVNTVKKISQTERVSDVKLQTTDDTFFVTSYSEMWNKNGILADSKPWYGNTGKDTEGKTYLWYKLHDIDGGNGNGILNKLYATNSNLAPGNQATTWERSIHCGVNDNYYLAVDANGALTSSNFNFGSTGVILTFCF